MSKLTVSRQALVDNPLFEGCSSEQIDFVCDNLEPMRLAKGDYLVRENEPGRGFFILLEGEISVLKIMQGTPMVVGRHEPGNFFGEIQILADSLTPVALRASADCILAKWDEAGFRRLLSFSRAVEKRIFQKISERLQGLANFVRTQEKMASLGTLAAGLAHELNNPAASLVRTLESLHPKILELQDMNLEYGRVEQSAAQTERWQKLRETGFNQIMQQPLKSREVLRREERFTDWLETLQVPKAYDLAGPLAESGLEIEQITTLSDHWRDDPTPMRYQGIQWLAMSFEVLTMVRDGSDAAKRISELVKSVKSYAYMDQAPQQFVDVHDGLESTLTMLKHQWKYGVKIIREYSEELPAIPVFGSQLNQVWTNIMTNAFEAMDGEGTLTIRTYQEGHHVVVAIIDDGPGIPSEIQSRIFDPFFTTKEVGKGTGLGLDIAYRIVTNRHHGYLHCNSQPGATRFETGLPVACPDGRTNADQQTQGSGADATGQ